MNNDLVYDNALWEYVLATNLQPYIPTVRKWWENYENLHITGTGVFNLELPDEDEIPPGLMVRVTSTAVRSPIKHVQIFPFLPTAYLQMAGVPGGVNKMIERICKNGLELDEFQILEKHNLPSTYHKGQFVAFVPKKIMDGIEDLGKYVYLTIAELCAIAKGSLPQSLICKCYQYIK